MLNMKRSALSAVLLNALCFPLQAFANWGFNMPRGVTPVSREIYDLHMTIFWVCVAIAVVVFGVLIYALIYHRKSRGVKAAVFHEHPVLEIIWAIIPFIILVAMAIPATRVLMAMENTTDADVTIKITGYQWKWRYDYLDEGISFFSNLKTPYSQITGKEKKGRWYLLEVDNEVVVPTNKKIRFLVTSADVIHSWWVPEFGIKRDGIPGFINQAWARIDKPGVYRGQCAELCGLNHAYMPIVVRAISPSDYKKWVASKTPKPEVKAKRERVERARAAKLKTYTKDELMKLGKNVYDKFCVVCHKADGTGMPPVFPALKASSISVNPPISRHIDMILKGVKGTAMQAFESQLTDTEIAALVTYERNAWGNNTGDVVQPAAVRDRKK